jgi:hypothetical protein
VAAGDVGLNGGDNMKQSGVRWVSVHGGNEVREGLLCPATCGDKAFDPRGRRRPAVTASMPPARDGRSHQWRPTVW